MLLPAENHYDTWDQLQTFSFPTSTQGCGPGGEHSVWPVPGLRVYEVWALLGELGWESSASMQGNHVERFMETYIKIWYLQK